MSGVRLYVGGHASRVQGERYDLTGFRMFTAAQKPQKCNIDASSLCSMLDSGAFSDAPHERLTPDAALGRQLTWERAAARVWGLDDFRSDAFVSYDLLIDETWVAGHKHKRRWDVHEAERAVDVTVEAAAYLSSQRDSLAPRRLVLSAQGVDALQYAECTAGVLRYAKPGDIFGLGGWCILGRNRSLMNEFWATLRLTLPMVAYAGLTDVHIFGVLYLPALGGLLALADSYGLTVSVDSTSPVLACTYKDKKRSGVRVASGYWRDNVAWWEQTLTTLRQSPYYITPPDVAPARQETLCLF